MQTGKSGKEKGLLVSGVLILTAANLVVKVLGFLYKVPLNALLGDEMANVNAAYAIYTVLYTIATAGVPSAVALLISSARAKGRYEKIAEILHVSLSVLLGCGFFLSLLLLIFARPLSLWNSGGDSFLCLLGIAPALFFVSASAVFRGYFQGFQRMTPTAVSELIEAGGKTVLGVSFVLLSLKVYGLSPRTAAALSIGGITAGIALGTLYLAIYYLVSKRKNLLYTPPPYKNEARAGGRGLFLGLVSLALPIAVTSAMMNLSTLVDAQLMRPLLTSFYGDGALAKSIYSDYSTGALTLYNMPGILIYPIASAIVPYISSAMVKGKRETAVKTVESAFRVASLIAMPSALGMSLLATPILRLVFGDDTMAKNTGGLLSVLAIAVFFVALLTVSNAVLQALGKEKRPLISVGIGLAVKLFCSLFLTARIGEVAAPIGTLLFFVTVVAINLFFVKKTLGVSLSVDRVFLRPFFTSAVSVLGAGVAYRALESALGNNLATVFAVVLAVLLYLPLVFLFRAVEKEDLSLLPFESKWRRFSLKRRKRTGRV